MAASLLSSLEACCSAALISVVFDLASYLGDYFALLALIILLSLLGAALDAGVSSLAYLVEFARLDWLAPTFSV